MGDKIQLFVRSGSNKNTTFQIHKDASIEDLMRKISDWNGIDTESQRVLFAAKELKVEKDGKKMYLSDYKIQEKSELFVVFRLPGGSDPTEGQGRQQKQLPDDVELTDLPDMITWDDDPTNQRVKMPCGHAIGPESLTAYCRSLLTAGKIQFHCPYIDHGNSTYCGQVWEYFTVRQLAVLTEDERKEFETKMSQNYMRKSAGIQECPRCTIFCMRKNPKDRRVVCLSCSKGGQMFEFCWYCLGDWKTPGITSCGNIACTGEDPRLKILKEASLKCIVGLNGCPSIRACPKCGMLIQHTKDCKHMVCVCGQKFCFICLTKAGSNGKYRCGLYNSHCSIAPIQKVIASDDVDDASLDIAENEADENSSERHSLLDGIDDNGDYYDDGDDDAADDDDDDDDDDDANVDDNYQDYDYDDDIIYIGEETISIASTDNAVFTNTDVSHDDQDERNEFESSENQNVTSSENQNGTASTDSQVSRSPCIVM